MLLQLPPEGLLEVNEASYLGGTGSGPGHLHSVGQDSLVVTQHRLRVDS